MQQSWQPKTIEGVPDGLVLFDGVCVLCSGWVRFLIERDNVNFFRFTPIQSPYGRALAQRLGINTEMPETNAVIIGGRAYFKADSAVEALTQVPHWRWVRIFAVVPRPVRDWLYDRVARNRYQLFGKTESCMVPTPELMHRFVVDEGGARDTMTDDIRSPFERLLGVDLERLPAPVRRVHTLRQPLATAGRAEITAASGLLARFVCWFAGLPRPGRDVDVSVTFAPTQAGGEHWDRKFADRRYASTMELGTGRDQGLLIEHFGLFDLRFKLHPVPEGLAWLVEGWRLLHIPLPRWSVPQIACVESADGERYTFDIDVTFPLIGWLMHYRGWLLPQDKVSASRQSA